MVYLRSEQIFPHPLPTETAVKMCVLLWLLCYYFHSFSLGITLFGLRCGYTHFGDAFYYAHAADDVMRFFVTGGDIALFPIRGTFSSAILLNA